MTVTHTQTSEAADATSPGHGPGAAAAPDHAGRPRHRRDQAVRRPRPGRPRRRQVRHRPHPRGPGGQRDRAADPERRPRRHRDPPRPDRVPHRLPRRAGRRASRSAPTSTPSPRPTGAGGRSSQQVRLTVRLRGEGATVTVYRSMANGRSQRVDSATVEGDAGEFSFDLPLKPFVDGGWYWYDAVAADEDAVVESAEWTAEVPEDRAAARHRHHRHHHHEPAGLLRQAARPARRGRPARGDPRRGRGHGAGQGQGRRLRVLPRGGEVPRRPAADHRAGQHRRLRRLRPGAVRGPQGRPLDVRDDARRRRRVRDRGRAAGGHLRRPVPQDDHRRRPHVQHLPEDPAALLRREGVAVHLLVGLGARRLRRLGLRRPQPPLRPAGCTPGSTSTTTAGSCA